MFRRKENKPEQEVPASRRANQPKPSKQKPALDRRRVEDRDEIDERELDKVAGGRMFRVDC